MKEDSIRAIMRKVDEMTTEQKKAFLAWLKKPEPKRQGRP